MDDGAVDHHRWWRPGLSPGVLADRLSADPSPEPRRAARIALPISAAAVEPARMAILATDASAAVVNDRSTISSATVSETPHRHAAPTNWRSVTPAGAMAAFDPSATPEATRMPSGLPTTSPATTPKNTWPASGDDRSSARC